MDDELYARLAAKSPTQRLQQVLEQGFRLPPRIAEAIVQEAESCLSGSAETVRSGQLRSTLARRSARPGKPLAQTELVEVTWTVDAGPEDLEVARRQGPPALRQVRVLRLLTEALDQGAVATTEDLARALQVSTRTIKRDLAALRAAGLATPTRGQLHQVGRGQTHKALILRRWLAQETYDQISRATHHTPAAIQRYVTTFLRVVQCARQGLSVAESARLVGIGADLVQAYRDIAQQATTPAEQARLEAELARLRQAPRGEKGGR